MEILLITILTLGFALPQESYPDRPITMVVRSTAGMGGVIMGKDPAATEAVTMLAVGHEPYEQSGLSIAAKAGQDTTDINHIDVRGDRIESVKRNHTVSLGDLLVNPDPHVVEYIGGACYGYGLWIQYTPFSWEINPNKKYALVVGVTPRLSS